MVAKQDLVDSFYAATSKSERPVGYSSYLRVWHYRSSYLDGFYESWMLAWLPAGEFEFSYPV